MKTKIYLWSGAAIVILAIAVAAAFWFWRPQVITLKDGTKLTLVGVSYGKHHVFRGIKMAGSSRPRGRATLNTTNDSLVVWIETEHKSNQWPNFQLMVYDKANTACASAWSRMNTQVKHGVDIMGFTLNAFPRRDRKMFLRVLSWGNGGQRVSKEQFVVSNPARGKKFPKWLADPVPDTQSDGDLDVTLTQLETNVPFPYGGNGAAKNDPASKCVQLNFDIQQKNRPVTNWIPVKVEASDATGNENTTWINQNGGNGYFFQPGLWPDEPAWKLRVEFSRKSGFSDDELWQVANIPARPGSQQDVWMWNGNSSGGHSVFAETTVNGIHLKLYPAIRYADQSGEKSVSFSIKADPDPESQGMRLTPLEVTDNQGHKLENRGSSWGGGNYQFQFLDSRNVQSLNITITLHKSRFVEFTVKPTKQ